MPKKKPTNNTFLCVSASLRENNRIDSFVNICVRTTGAIRGKIIKGAPNAGNN